MATNREQLATASVAADAATDDQPLLSRVQAAIRELEPAAQIVLFGSRARGDAEPDSDWDVLVLLDGAVDPERERAIRQRLYELELDTGAIISSFIHSKEEWDSPLYRATPLHWNVDRDGVELGTETIVLSNKLSKQGIEEPMAPRPELRRLIESRLGRARKALSQAQLMATHQHWNAAVSRLYYACFYAFNALLASQGVALHKHTAIRARFNRDFVQTGVFPPDLGQLYNDLFKLRNDADYGDFVELTEDQVRPLIADVERFLVRAEELVAPPPEGTGE